MPCTGSAKFSKRSKLLAALRERPTLFSGALRSLQRAIAAQRDGLGRLTEGVRYTLAFMVGGKGAAAEPADADADRGHDVRLHVQRVEGRGQDAVRAVDTTLRAGDGITA